MTPPPDPPPTVATMRRIGFVWVAVGGVAIVGGAVGTVVAIVVFGVIAALIGGGLIAIQNVRANSAERASRTLTNPPPSPADTAAPPPAPEPEPEPEPDRDATDEDQDRDQDEGPDQDEALNEDGRELDDPEDDGTGDSGRRD